MNPLFDVEEIEERLKNVKSLADLTGKDGVLKEGLRAFEWVFYGRRWPQAPSPALRILWTPDWG
jgi:hypothetical protein